MARFLPIYSAVISTITLLLVIFIRPIKTTTNYPPPTPSPNADVLSVQTSSTSASITNLDDVKNELAKIRADQRNILSFLKISGSPEQTGSFTEPLDITPSPIPQLLTLKSGVTTANVYADKVSSSRVVGRITPSQNYPYTTKVDGWYRITLSDGTTGWVRDVYLDIVSPDTITP